MPGAASHPRKNAPSVERTAFSGLVWSVVGLGLFAALFLASGLTLARLAALVAAIPLWAYAVMAALQVGVLMLATLKWTLILARLPVAGVRLPPGDALAATTFGALAGQILPIQLVTPVIRAWVARPHGISAGRAVGTSVFEQVFEVVALGAMAVASALILLAGFAGLPALALAGLIALAVSLAIAPGLRLSSALIGRAAALLPDMAARALGLLARAMGQASDFPRAILLTLTALSFLRYGLLVALNVGIIALLAPEADLTRLALAYPLVLLVMSLPFIPGGLGVVEATWTGVLVSTGLPVAEAVEIALVLRIVSTGAFLAVAPLLVLWRSTPQKAAS